VTDAVTLDGVCDGIDTLVHLVAIIEEQGGATFDTVIRQGSENIFREAQRAGVRHVIYVSALGAQDNPRFQYHQAKWRAEQALMQSGLPHTILRPSIIFGPGDGFLSLLAGVIRAFPLTPIIGDGKALFQPVNIRDIAEIVARLVDEPNVAPSEPMEIGGPDVFTFEELIGLIREELGIQRPKVHVPVPLMRTVVTLSGPLPKAIRPPVTMEQLKMLQLDNSTPNSWTERLLGRPATPLRGSLGYLRSDR
jgi:NADH dehydrogenase